MSSGPQGGMRGRHPVKPPWERFAINWAHSYLRAPLPRPSYPVDVSAGILNWQMLGNGPDPTLTVHGGQPVGDCTFAARQHLRMAKAAAAGISERWETTDELVTEYLAYDHGVDRGANIADVLMHWFLSGRIKAFAPVDHDDPAACDSAMAAFHGLYVGVDLTDEADAQFAAGEPWSTDNGERPDPNDGHCIVKVGADGRHYDTWVTWGAQQRSTMAWTQACVREAWVVVTTEDQASLLDMPTLLAHIVAASKMGPAGRPFDPGRGESSAGAFAIGWQVAQMFGPLAVDDGRPSPADHLPCIREYDAAERMELAFEELEHLLCVARLDDVDRWGRQETASCVEAQPRRDGLRRLHVLVQDRLVCDDARLAAAYQLGVAFSDLTWLAGRGGDGDKRDALLAAFSRPRMAELHGWLGQITCLAPRTAPVVARSLQTWSDWVDAGLDEITGPAWAAMAAPVTSALANQARAWSRLLSSDTADPGDPPIGAWVQAGESILRSSGKTVASVVRHFWWAILLAVVLTGGLVALALVYSHGTAKVWTTLVTVAASVGLTGTGLRSGAQKVAGGVEQTTWQAATLDAQAWAVTWLPVVALKRATNRELRRRGVAPPVTGARLEAARPSRPTPPAPPPG